MTATRTLPAAIPAAKYIPLNGAELAAILLRRATLALDGHCNFAEGIKFRDAEFHVKLTIDIPNAPPMHVDLVTLTIANRNGLEIRRRILAQLDAALASGTCFAEGIAYPLFTARLTLHTDAAGAPPTSQDLYYLVVTDDDPPDRIRLANALPTTLDLLPTDEEAAALAADGAALDGAMIWQPGDRVKHPAYNSGKAVVVDAVEADGLRVTIFGKPARIARDSDIYRGLELAERPHQG